MKNIESSFIQNIPPPTHAEKSVLATILLKPILMPSAASLINAGMFGGKDEKSLAQAIWGAYSEKLTINAASISAKVPGLDVFNLLHLVDPENFTSNCEVIKHEYIRRQELVLSYETYQRLSRGEEDVDAIMSSVNEARAALYAGNQERKTKDQQIAETVAWLKKCMDVKGISGYPTGYNNLNNLTGGWQPGELIIIGARPAMGKTSFALSSLIRATLSGSPALFLTCEMSENEILLKANAFFSGIQISHARKGELSPGDANAAFRAFDKIAELPIFIEDVAGKTASDIRFLIQEYKRRHGVGIVVIDYLQLIASANNKGRTRENDVSEISRALKITARLTDTAIICLSQLSRAVETRGGSKRPMLSDLRESGSIEQDADMVGFLYRPEYYGIMEDEEGNSLAGVTELIIAKNRNGALKTLKYKFVVTDYKEFGEEGEVQTTIYNPQIVRAPGLDDEELPF